MDFRKSNKIFVMALWRISSLCFRSRCGLVMQNAFFSSQDRYVIILPEIPDATAQTNSLLSVVHGNDLPPFDKLSTRESADACAKLALEFEAWMQEHGSSFNSENYVCNFENVIDRVEMHLAPMQFAWNTFRHLAGVRRFDPNLMARFKGLQNLVTRARIHRFNNHRFFTAVMDLSHDKNLNSVQSILIAKYIREMQLNGLGLSDKNYKWLEEYRRRIYDAVFKFRLKQAAVKRLSEQVEMMQPLAARQDALRSPLKPWDLDYYARKLAEHDYDIDFGQTAEYFPYMQFLSNVFELIKRLFDITFTLVSGEAAVWDKEVQLFEVTDEKARSSVIGHTPVVYLNLNLSSESLKTGVPAFLHWDHLVQFFPNYSELASGDGIERDCIMIYSFFFEHLFMRPDCLADLSKHYRTNEKLSKNESANFIHAIREMQIPALVQNILLSEFDLLIHKSSMKFWFDIYRELSKQYFPYGWEKGDYLPCNSSIVVDEQVASSYYRQLISDIIACDLINDIGENTQLNSAEFVNFCKKFKNCYLLADGSMKQLEMYRSFAKRESPSVNAFLNLRHEVKRLLLDPVRVLRQDPNTKMIAVHAKQRSSSADDADTQLADAVVVFEKKPFSENQLFNLLKNDTIKLTKNLMNNDIYSIHLAVAEQPDDDLNALQLTLIQPASEQHIQKWSEEERCMVSETADDYRSITLQYIEKNKLSLQWVQNVLDGTAESERIVYNDPDPEVGFVLAPSLRWDGKDVNQLYLTAICRRQNLKSLRDLRAEHLPMLQNIFTKSTVTIEERYGVPVNRLCIFFHYQPTYYHLHIHFTHLREATAGTSVGRAHLYADVVDNLRSDSDYYAKRTMHFSLRNNDPLLHQLLGIEKQTTTMQDE
ncbi:m7GpppX diphosphatase [Trichinella nelsoni]|uniref:m7GpppX diphosphatase n=1 Tax=Trichinella nelsoni TaxID=6336 RepID=A0A0V0S8J2_9BILA|nr:m7GpppX diphosphatase [Trichinella nelsoni]